MPDAGPIGHPESSVLVPSGTSSPLAGAGRATSAASGITPAWTRAQAAIPAPSASPKVEDASGSGAVSRMPWT
jgi:hypothetical protein